MASFDDCLEATKNLCPLISEGFQFKEKQLDTLKALYQGKDCVTVLPTGYGKSILFQCLPWFCQAKLGRSKPMSCIIISPLSSLMEDQVMGLRRKGVQACYINVTGLSDKWLCCYNFCCWFPPISSDRVIHSGVR